MVTVNQIVYNYLRNNLDIKSEYNGFFYLINDNKVKQPYATIFTVDDPNDVKNLCAKSQGQMRFQCDSFTKTFVKGVDKREIYQEAIKNLENTTTSGVKIFTVEIVNVVDRGDTINGLFQFSFEAVVNWERV